MLNWLFKKKPVAPPAPVRAPAPPPLAAPSPEVVAARAAEWAARVDQARGDDTALLALAREAPQVDTKLAAVEALVGEAALKEAEREFRTHDRRVHRAAKQRLATAVATRTARDAAERLVAAADALRAEPVIPANRLVALDREWQALDAALLEPAQAERFQALTGQLTALMHERAEREAAIARWTASAREALAGLQTVSLAVAQGVEALPVLTAAQERTAELLAALPLGHDDRALVDELGAARLLALQVSARVALLDSLLAEPAPVAEPAVEVPAVEPDEDGAAPAPDLVPQADATAVATDRWTSLPPVAEARAARALDQRWAAWLRAKAPAVPEVAPAPPAEKKPPRARATPPDPAAVARADALLQQAEAALAEGHLAEAHQHLTALDELAMPPQRPRLQGLWAEHARLKGWQQWGGGRARDDLVAEAEALAAASSAPDAKVNVRQQADALDALRKRWKELDRLGGATSQPLWQRFDAALKTAHGPVAAAQARVEAERQANLEAREALLAVLEATPPAGDTGWREQVRALDTFQQAWRKHGPLEHTVPHKSRDALVARWRAAVARIEEPLEAARREAERGREALIERADALAREGESGQGRDLVPRVRDLQAEWQEHAKAVPLARAAENALWARFKAATDAVFAQREAAFNARDDVFKANLMAREALVSRLASLEADTPAGELKKVLSEVDRQWPHAGEVPRQEAARVEAAYRQAREVAQGHLAASAQRTWQGTVDSLVARLALCEQREGGAPPEALEAEWQAQRPLPAAWDRALVSRWSNGPVPADPAAVDDGLLQLEMALDMPSPEAYQAARRDWKLRAMKAALESRQAAPAEALGLDEALARLLVTSGLSPAQRERLEAAVTVLRRRPR